MNAATDNNQIAFKQSTSQFIEGWNKNRLMRQTGHFVASLLIVISLLYFVIFILTNLSNVKDFWNILVNGSVASRIFWLALLLLLPSTYLLDEIKRQFRYTSRDDVYTYMDQITRFVLVDGLYQSFRLGQRLTIDFLLLIFSSSAYFQRLLSRLEVDNKYLVENLPTEIGHKPSAINGSLPELDDDLRKLLLNSAERAIARGDLSFGVADIFLTMLQTSPQISEFFNRIDVTPEKFSVVTSWLSTQDHIRQEHQLLQSARMHTGERNQAWTSIPTPTLNQYGHDLTLSASYGVAPLISVRGQEVDTLISVLSRMTKNSALLIGEPGIGKSSIVDRVALKMLTQDVLEPMKDKRLIQLDLAAMHADQRGFGAVFEQAVSEGERAGNCIIYISSLSDLATEVSSGLSSAELLLPILDRQRMQIIGAASEKEYREFIEPIAEFNDKFDVIRVKEISQDAAMKVLEEIGLNLEYRHHIEISLKAMESAIELSDRYIHDRVLPEKAIDVLDQAATEASAAGKIIVSEADVDAVVSKETSVPVGGMTKSEGQLLLNLGQVLHSMVVGQNEAVDAVVSAMQRARAGTGDSQRPIGVFLFVGPTGVGKTELAKALSTSYFGTSENMVRLDMSEYNNAESVTRLLGDGQTGGLLTEPIRTKPFILLLLDEFEKSSKDVRNLFLQVFDDGRLTDGSGHLVDFRNTIIIATSNAGSLEIQQRVSDNEDYETIKGFLMDQVLPGIFSPEMLNRFDGVIVFRSLNQSDILQIAKLNIKTVVDNLYRSHGISLTVNDEVIQKLAESGFSPEFGGRPLRRVIQEKLETPLARKILSGEIKRGDNYGITLKDM